MKKRRLDMASHLAIQSSNEDVEPEDFLGDPDTHAFGSWGVLAGRRP